MTNHEEAANEVRRVFAEAGVEVEEDHHPAMPEFGSQGYWAFFVEGFEVQFQNWHSGVWGDEANDWVCEHDGTMDDDDVDHAPVVEWVRNWCAARA